MKKFCAIILTISLVISFAPCYAQTFGFSDMNEADWYYQTVTNMVQQGLVNGYEDGTFRPNNTISRIEFTKIAYAAFPMGHKHNEVSEEAKTEYLEAASSFWGRELVVEAVERGMGRFGIEPEEWEKPITRAEMAYVAYAASATSSKDAELAYYVDVLTAFGDYGDCLASDYCTAIVVMCSTGVFGGINENKDFAPENTATRAEACTLINRLLDKSLRYDPFTYVEKDIDSPFFTSYISKSMGQEVKTYGTAPVDYSYLPSTAKGTNYTDSVYGGMSEKEAAEVKVTVDGFLTKYIRPNMSELEKACIAAEYIMRNCNYVYDDDAESYYTAWGALVGGQASCWGFSHAYKLLCDAMDIGCAVVPADENSPNPHQWNVVRIDGYWYVIDVQACDLARDMEVYNNLDFYMGSGDPHFLVSDDTYYRTTLIEGENGYTWHRDEYPVCSYNYFDDISCRMMA